MNTEYNTLNVYESNAIPVCEPHIWNHNKVKKKIIISYSFSMFTVILLQFHFYYKSYLEYIKHSNNHSEVIRYSENHTHTKKTLCKLARMNYGLYVNIKYVSLYLCLSTLFSSPPLLLKINKNNTKLDKMTITSTAQKQTLTQYNIIHHH